MNVASAPERTSAEIVRRMIEQENALRDQRLGWMFALNGFLFTALGFMWKNSKAVSLIIAGLGVAMAVSSYATLRVSTLAIRLLRARAPKPRSGDNVVVGLRSGVLKHPTEFEQRECKLRATDRLIPFLYTWSAAPVFLFVAWFCVFIARAVQQP
jgi:hypothetical protein